MSEMLPNLAFLLGAKQAAELQAADDARYAQTHGDTAWHINNSTWKDYTAGVYFPGLKRTLDEVIESIHTESTTGLDIAGGSNGAAMIELIQRGVLSQAAVTNLEDRRNETARADTRVTHISGDLTTPATWGEIMNWQIQTAPIGLKLVSHEPRDTLQWFGPHTYEGAAQLLLNMVASGGILLSQIPVALGLRGQRVICRNLERRPDVQDIYISDKLGRYRQALVVKEA